MNKTYQILLASLLISGLATESSAQSTSSLERAQKNRTAIANVTSQYRSGSSNHEMARFGPRIINGQTVANEDRDWSWAVSLQTADGRHFCGGSLVSPLVQNGSVIDWVGNDNNPKWVVTAAHCVVERDGTMSDPADLTVQSGNVSLFADPRVRQGVEAIFVHPNYNDDTLENDVALLKLKEPVAAPSGVKRTSIRIADGLDRVWLYRKYTALTVSGWGRTESGPITTVLEQVVVPFVDTETCREAYSMASSTIQEGMICSGFSTGGYDSCQGDSGGGLVFRPARFFDDPVNEPVLAGIVSWGIGCARADLYGVYSNALMYRHWLDVIVAENS